METTGDMSVIKQNDVDLIWLFDDIRECEDLVVSLKITGRIDMGIGDVVYLAQS